MTDYSPLNIKEDTKQRLMQHKQHKRDTQDDVVNQVLDIVEGKDTAEPTEPVPIEEVVGREVLIDELSNIEAAVKENTNKVEQTKSLVEDLGGKR